MVETGQMVVETAIVTVVTEPYGQAVMVGAHEEMVNVEVA